MFRLKICTQFAKHYAQLCGQHQTCVKQPLRHIYRCVPNRTDTTAYEQQDTTVKTDATPLPFAALLRRSPFIQVGEHKNVNVVGKIVQVIDDHIYVDFGGKFLCVCDLHQYSDDPEKHAMFYRGRYVVVRLNDFELSARFIGSHIDTTLLEADAVLVGLYRKHSGRKRGTEAKKETNVSSTETDETNVSVDGKTET